MQNGDWPLLVCFDSITPVSESILMVVLRTFLFLICDVPRRTQMILTIVGSNRFFFSLLHQNLFLSAFNVNSTRCEGLKGEDLKEQREARREPNIAERLGFFDIRLPHGILVAVGGSGFKTKRWVRRPAFVFGKADDLAEVCLAAMAPNTGIQDGQRRPARHRRSQVLGDNGWYFVALTCRLRRAKGSFAAFQSKLRRKMQLAVVNALNWSFRIVLRAQVKFKSGIGSHSAPLGGPLDHFLALSNGSRAARQVKN